MEKGKDFDIDELQLQFPEAYAELPESYKADSCLRFFVDPNGHLCSEDDHRNVYLFVEGKWEMIEDNLPF